MRITVEPWDDEFIKLAFSGRSAEFALVCGEMLKREIEPWFVPQNIEKPILLLAVKRTKLVCETSPVHDIMEEFLLPVERLDDAIWMKCRF